MRPRPVPSRPPHPPHPSQHATRRWADAAARLGVCALAAILAGACADGGPTRPRGGSHGAVHPDEGPDGGLPGPGPRHVDISALVPERLRIHPLTRFTESDDGETQLVLHLELRDRFGHSIKSLGKLYIELDRPREGGIDPTMPPPSADGAGPDGRATDVYWEVDLRNPETNALMYDDLISRTYLIYLGGLPGWAERWARGDPGAALDDALTLRATFYPTPFNGEPEPPPLRATYRLER